MNLEDDLQPLLLTTDQLLDRGMTRYQVSRAVNSGELFRIRPGFYVDSHARDLAIRDRHLLSVLAADAALGGPVFSHSSAALIHGLPDWGLPLRRVAVSEEAPAPRSRTSALTISRSVPDLSDQVMTVNGLKVTSPARTVTDLAMSTTRDASVAVADAALRGAMVTTASLEESLAGAAGRRGVRRARHALSLVDGRSESVAETLSRLTFRDFGLPEPETQVEIVNARGVRVGRVDFLWREYGVIGECDGFGKYFDGLTPAETRRRLAMEKDRDGELIALGYRVFHWRWRDLEEPHVLAARLKRVLSHAAN
nr:type IV toxin-antitoxin system AbiEi family antitoxin domain-containing protein [Actinomycetales bacterium]